jgi:hypothetical protein
MRQKIQKIAKQIFSDEKKLVHFTNLKNFDEIYDYFVSIEGGYTKEEFKDYMNSELNVNSELKKPQKFLIDKFNKENKKRGLFSRILSASFAVMSLISPSFRSSDAKSPNPNETLILHSNEEVNPQKLSENKDGENKPQKKMRKGKVLALDIAGALTFLAAGWFARVFYEGVNSEEKKDTPKSNEKSDSEIQCMLSNLTLKNPDLHSQAGSPPHSLPPSISSVLDAKSFGYISSDGQNLAGPFSNLVYIIYHVYYGKKGWKGTNASAIANDYIKYTGQSLKAFAESGLMQSESFIKDGIWDKLIPVYDMNRNKQLELSLQNWINNYVLKDNILRNTKNGSLINLNKAFYNFYNALKTNGRPKLHESLLEVANALINSSGDDFQNGKY